MRHVGQTLVLAVLLVAVCVGIAVYTHHTAAERALATATARNHELETFVRRLAVDRRVANVLVTDQRKVDGVLRTSLLFVEVAPDGRELPPKRFELQGDSAHIDALVIQFDRDFVEKGDPLRGQSICLFTRMFGDYQTPADGFPIDSPGQIPDAYKPADPAVSAFYTSLWQDFWRLTTDAAYRKEKGVRLAEGQSNWGPFEPDRLYTITLQAAGGLDLTSEPLKGIYKEAMRGHEGT